MEKIYNIHTTQLLACVTVTELHTCNNPDTGQLVSDWAGGQTCDPGALLLGPGGGSWALTPAPGVPWSPVPGPCAPSARSPVARDHRAGAIFTALARTGSQPALSTDLVPWEMFASKVFCAPDSNRTGTEKNTSVLKIQSQNIVSGRL